MAKCLLDATTAGYAVMSLDVYFRADVARVLDSVDIASGRTAALVLCDMYHSSVKNPDPTNAQLARDMGLYRQGFRDALVAVARAFGVDPDSYVVDRHVDPASLPNIEHFQPLHWER